MAWWNNSAQQKSEKVQAFLKEFPEIHIGFEVKQKEMDTAPLLGHISKLNQQIKNLKLLILQEYEQQEKART